MFVFLSIKGTPLKFISPDVGTSNKFKHLSKVDLPDPDEPIIVTTWPFSIFKFIPFNTSKLSKVL